MTVLVVGLDLGGSRSKWQVRGGGQVIASGSAAPLTATLLGTPTGQDHLQELRAALPTPLGAAWAGLPGYSATRPDAAALRATLAAALGLEPTRLHLESDLDLAYRAHLRPGEAVLLYAGTGSVAYHVAPDGQIYRAGGHGFHIDDDGAGYALGRAALRALVSRLDRGVPPEGPLAREVAAVTGGLDWDTLRQFTYGQPGAAAVARLAPALGRAADAGDPAALGALRRTAEALAGLASTVQGRLSAPVGVVATGGAFRVSRLFAEELGRICPDVVVRQGDHAQAAAVLAEGVFTPRS